MSKIFWDVYLFPIVVRFLNEHMTLEGSGYDRDLDTFRSRFFYVKIWSP